MCLSNGQDAIHHIISLYQLHFIKVSEQDNIVCAFISSLLLAQDLEYQILHNVAEMMKHFPSNCLKIESKQNENNSLKESIYELEMKNSSLNEKKRRIH
jgi:cell shape-determining protein MreC